MSTGEPKHWETVYGIDAVTKPLPTVIGPDYGAIKNALEAMELERETLLDMVKVNPLGPYRLCQQIANNIANAIRAIEEATGVRLERDGAQ